ncbi:MAG: hypothetical protein M1839_003201 [Geoglossum umbratile]|nr:MAG: hypothetical protein M1839_003201 [Geoglossum umbratile]
MAEPFAVVGLAASIVTFVDVSAKVLNRLREFYSTAEDMPGVFQDIMTQLPLIVDTMTRIEEGYEGGSLTGDTQRKLLHVVKGCLRQITMLDGLIEKMLRNPTDSRLQQARKAIASVFKEKDVAGPYKLAGSYSPRREDAGFSRPQHLSLQPFQHIAIATRENTYYEIPSLRASQFVERVGLLEEIEAGLLNTTAHAPDVKIVVLLGMGGQGKTQLALEYCRVSRTSGRYQGIFWVDASSPNTVSCGFETIAAKISRIGCVFVDVESKIAFVKETLGRWKIPWLIVFDNYDQPGEFRNIAEYFPHGGSGAILVTSRHSDSERLGVTIRFMRMTEDEGLELLLRQTKLEKNDDNIIEGKKIIQKLSYLPLAIDQAAAYINTRKLLLPLFAKHYDERKELVLKHTPPLWEYRKRLGKDKDETLLSVFTTWELSFQQIGKNENE